MEIIGQMMENGNILYEAANGIEPAAVYGILTLICMPIAFVLYYYDKEKKKSPCAS